jgi:hypothetical protein
MYRAAFPAPGNRFSLHARVSAPGRLEPTGFCHRTASAHPVADIPVGLAVAVTRLTLHRSQRS